MSCHVLISRFNKRAQFPLKFIETCQLPFIRWSDKTTRNHVINQNRDFSRDTFDDRVLATTPRGDQTFLIKKKKKNCSCDPVKALRSSGEYFQRFRLTFYSDVLLITRVYCIIIPWDIIKKENKKKTNDANTKRNQEILHCFKFVFLWCVSSLLGV